MLKEFKAFAMKGNMIDMAIGIVIGAAFGTVIKSLVDDLLMPVVSAIFNAPDFSNLFVLLKAPEVIEGINMARSAIHEQENDTLGFGCEVGRLGCERVNVFGNSVRGMGLIG